MVYHGGMTTTRQLELFIAVADAGSMRKAADLLGISQPSISKQIRALERSVGGTLIQRIRGERATLTPLGLELVGDARSSIEMHRRFVQRKGGDVPLRMYLRSYLLEFVKKRFDKLEAAGLLSVMSTSDSPQTSFAICGLVSLPAGKDHISHVLVERACSVYASPQLAAALADGSSRIEDVANLYPSKVFKPTPWLRAMMRHAGLASRNEVFGLQFMEMIAEQVANGEGLSVFMDFHVQPMVDQARIVPLAPCRDPLLQVLMASPVVDSALFARMCRVWQEL
jgi:DNA-binding transcriptional LysR family regulator